MQDGKPASETRQRGNIVRELAVFATIFFTVVLALATGVGLGFTCINSILHVMGHRTQSEPEVAALHPAEVISGD